MSKSLRSRLLIRIALTTLVVLSTTAATTFVLVRRSLLKEFDSLLGTKAEAMTKLVEQDHDKLRIEFTDHRMREFVRNIRPEYYEVWSSDGIVIARSPHLDAKDLISNPDVADDTYSFTELPDGRHGRLVTERFVPVVDDESLPASGTESIQNSKREDSDSSAVQRRQMTLSVACGTEEIDEAVNRLAWMILAASSAALVLLIGALAWTVTYALRPLESLASQIAIVDEHSLSTRFDVTGTPSEIVPVVERANSLMQRLEQAFAHERTFAADVAHELRTPLAGLRSTLQIALSRPRDQSEYCGAICECEKICANIQRLVETLLSLARLELDTSREDWGYIDISVLVDNVWRSFEETSRQRQLCVTRDGPDGVFLHADTNKMRVVLSNLFDNAVAHSDPGGTVDIRWNVSETGLILKVANSGCHLNSDQIPHVFDRFWRGDPARADTGVHAGLGLALCRKIVDACSGLITAESWDDTFEVTLAFGSTCVELSDKSTTEPDALCVG